MSERMLELLGQPFRFEPHIQRLVWHAFKTDLERYCHPSLQLKLPSHNRLSSPRKFPVRPIEFERAFRRPSPTVVGDPVNGSAIFASPFDFDVEGECLGPVNGADQVGFQDIHVLIRPGRRNHEKERGQNRAQDSACPKAIHYLRHQMRFFTRHNKISPD